MAAIMSLSVALFVVLISNETISPAMKGLALSYTTQVKLDSLMFGLFFLNRLQHVFMVSLYVTQLTGMLQYVVRQSTEVEARFNSVERVQEYTTVRLPPCYCPGLLGAKAKSLIYYSDNLCLRSFLTTLCFQVCKSEAPRHTKGTQIPEGWPKGGAITFKDFKMRYRENTPIVLNGLDFVILAGEKLGIVGRTGSGKALNPVDNNYSFVFHSDGVPCK